MRAPFILLLTVLLACLATTQTWATGKGDFAQGNQFYAAGNYKDAVAAYESQVRRGEDSANLFYNLGDAYYKLGSRGRAILNYQRALWLEPSHGEAAANLAFLGGNRPASSASGGMGSVDVLSWLTAGAGWLAMVGVLMALFLRRQRTAGTTVAVAGLLICAAGAGALWWMDGGGRNAPRALVIADAGTPALYSPADNSKAITSLPVGTEVRILSMQGAWIYALLGDGTRAWVASDKVERLIPSR